jgi:hypothetical protein
MRNNRNEKGAVMVLVMIITGIIACLCILYMATSTAQQKQVDSSIDDQGFYQSALSGFEMAKAYLINKYTGDTSGWDNELALSNAMSASYYATTSVFPGAASISVPIASFNTAFQWCRNIDYHGSTFFAKLENNNDGGGTSNDTDNILKLTVEGWGGGNATGQRSQQIILESMVSYKIVPYAPESAVVVGGSLKVKGSVYIEGVPDALQTNGLIEIDGGTISGNVVSSGTVNQTGGTVNGTKTSNAAPVKIPEIKPSDYAYLADHIFKPNGKVYNSTGVQIATPLGWSYDGTSTWKKTGNDIDNGVYYFYGVSPPLSNANVEIGGSEGSGTNPVTVTMIAEGGIKITGSPSLMPSPLGGGICLMAGGDLMMRGAGGNVYGNGLYAAHEQVSLNGTPDIRGVLLAEDAIDKDTLVSSGSLIDVTISGNSNIQYNGTLTTILKDGYPYMEMRGFKKHIRK